MNALSVEYEKEKQSLMKHAIDAEEKLKVATEELGGLKRHIRHMTQAIFGKPPHPDITYFLVICEI
jgi:hypothetical protein